MNLVEMIQDLLLIGGGFLMGYFMSKARELKKRRFTK